MEKLFDIVESYIPEDKQADIKAKFDGILETTLKERDINIKRELSDKFKVDLFFEGENTDEAYKKSAFVKKEQYNKVVEENKETLSNLENLTQIKTELEKEREKFHMEQQIYESSLSLVGGGFNPERLHLVKGELTGVVEDDVKNISTKYPELFNKTVTRNPFPGVEDNTKKTAAELYIEKRKKEAERKF